MEAPEFTGTNPETHKRLLHMMMFIFISNVVVFIFKKIVVSWGTFLGRPVLLSVDEMCASWRENQLDNNGK